MSAYMIYLRDEIIDQKEMDIYNEESKKAPHEYEARPLAFYGKTVTLEGPEVDGATIIEFKNIEEAKATYDNPVYQEAMKHRLKGAKYRVFVIEGLPGGDLNG